MPHSKSPFYKRAFLLAVLVSTFAIQSASAADDSSAFDKVSDDWSKSFIFEDGTYSEIFMGLQMIGDAYLVSQYSQVSEDEAFKQKMKKIKDDGLAKISVFKEKAIPYILSDLISNASMRHDASLKYKKMGWNVPIILLRSTEARDQAIKDALLGLDKDKVTQELAILQKKIGKADELGELSATVDDFTKSVQDSKSSEKK